MENWIIPCNIKQFNIIDHFKNNDYVVWKNSFTIMAGDIVYIYIGAPFGELKFKCEVLSNEVDEQELKVNSYAIVERKSNNFFSKKIKYIRMKKVCEYQEGTFKLSNLKEHGLGQVQIQARTDRRLQAYINLIEESRENNL